AGGTIAAHAARGDHVFIAILTEGASVQFPGEDDKIALKKRQAREAAEVLGAREIFSGDFPDQRLDVTPRLEVNRFVERVAREVEPHVIYTHHFADLNSDHRVAYEAAAVAARPFSLPSFERLLCYSVDTLTHAGSGAQAFNLYSDITETLELKLKAMQVYETEVRAYPHPRSLEALRHMALRNGAMVGLHAAEVFQSVLEVRKG
ncbi:MAG TPA: PIG-L family deacetylase, partial [Pyrinomonadaceae bacterium]|nr:PIG-L family deacetylase [Pyrinomonadaceae bacterium]